MNIVDIEARSEFRLRRAEARRDGKPFPPQDDEFDKAVKAILRSGLRLIGYAFFLISAAMLSAWLSQNIASIRGWLVGALDESWVRVLCSLAVVGIGCAAYWVRQKRRVLYALAELGAAFGLAYAVFVEILRDGSVSWLPWLGLCSAVFVTVRGLENLGKGIADLAELSLAGA